MAKVHVHLWENGFSRQRCRSRYISLYYFFSHTEGAFVQTGFTAFKGLKYGAIIAGFWSTSILSAGVPLSDPEEFLYVLTTMYCLSYKIFFNQILFCAMSPTGSSALWYETGYCIYSAERINQSQMQTSHEAHSFGSDFELQHHLVHYINSAVPCRGSRSDSQMTAPQFWPCLLRRLVD